MFRTDIIENFWASGLWNAIKYTCLGMIGIFIVTSIIILTVYLLNKATNIEPKENKED